MPPYSWSLNWLAELNLTVSQPEQVLICQLCKCALHVAESRTFKHLSQKHNTAHHIEVHLTRYLRSLSLRNPLDVPPRKDGLSPHPHLVVQHGHACRECGFRTSNRDTFRRHLSKSHHLRPDRHDHGHTVYLQSWTQGGPGERPWWIVRADLVSPEQVRGTSPTEQSTFLQELRQQEQCRIQRTMTNVENSAHADNSNSLYDSPWVERTRWKTTFHGLRRDILMALTQLPDRHSREHGYPLGILEGYELLSPREDDICIQIIVNAVDQVYDRCEDTVEHTGEPILCWLRSRHRNQAYRLPFQLVSKPASRRQYRRLMKRFCTMLFRWRRLHTDITQKVIPRHLQSRQKHLIDQVWTAALQLLENEKARPKAADQRSIRSFSLDASDLHGDTIADEETSELSDSGSEWNDDGNSSDETSHSAYEEFTADACDQTDTTHNNSLGDDEPLFELVFMLLASFCLEEFRDGQPSSSLLVFFSGVLGFTPDATTFRRARDYTPYLSALIHQQQLLCLEYALPFHVYPYLKRPARPVHNQLRCLNSIRNRYMCSDSVAPVGEFYSLRDFGRKALQSEGPSFWVRWSDDGQILFFAEYQLRLSQFRQFASNLLETATARCSRLMFDWLPDVNLSSVKDDFRNTHCGYSFVQDSRNHLCEAYLELLDRASATDNQPLIQDGYWVQSSVLQFLHERDALVNDILLLLLVLGGQDPRLVELLLLLISNSPTKSRGIFVYNGYIIFVIEHHKARRRTNKAFYVARYLPFRAGLILYYYLVFIHRFSDLLLRQCFQVATTSNLLFVSDPVVAGSSSPRPWTSRDLTQALQQRSSPIFRFPCGGRLYRQLSIALTEKHIKPNAELAAARGSRNISTDIDLVLAWQSGHQVEERRRTQC